MRRSWLSNHQRANPMPICRTSMLQPRCVNQKFDNFHVPQSLAIKLPIHPLNRATGIWQINSKVKARATVIRAFIKNFVSVPETGLYTNSPRCSVIVLVSMTLPLLRINRSRRASCYFKGWCNDASTFWEGLVVWLWDVCRVKWNLEWRDHPNLIEPRKQRSPSQPKQYERQFNAARTPCATRNTVCGSLSQSEGTSIQSYLTGLHAPKVRVLDHNIAFSWWHYELVGKRL